MTSAARTGLLIAVLGGLASPAAAQLWEVQVGGAAAYGTINSLGFGAGPVFGFEPGRLFYLGARWEVFVGGTTIEGTGAAATEVRSERSGLFAVDFGLVIPKGRVEIIPGGSIGSVRFLQDTRPSGSGAEWQSFESTEFMLAPGMAVEWHLGRLSLIPEVQYMLVSHPNLPYPGKHEGLAASLRVVYKFEIDRIRQ